MSAETSVVPDRLVNLRDVGAASDRLRRGVLLRSDAPHPGDVGPQDVVWPPRTVLDLRDVGEGGREHPLREVARVVSLPVLTGATRADRAGDVAPFDLGRFYVELLHGAGAAYLVDGVRAVAADDAPVLVHCTAGKDRTGVLVAILLSLVGVDRADIVTDYVRTEPNMPGIIARARLAHRTPERDAHVLATLPPELLTAPAHAMEAVLDALAAHDDGAAGWFAAHGGEPGTVSALRARLLR
ncbi:tyrosine phosphatase family protein [Isoptericola sp. CG 20/1183]|uniref:Tyrosine phosphatase family protein n=1 Tax=Isoptericola halotolerans TaxID=300560 RepID=A0ABX5EM80_9MICO|nr:MULTISPECIES: tyrosine-protein phosphatase [Isoptericola]PRZ09448.1 tyrosine phosphatase family protein [Isoptericola sp. CG 20/1183]PRZ10249.1 tyrosine phosphatase family protein [Isoptericola halotolerans]